MDQGRTSAQAGMGQYPYGEDVKKNISPALLIPDNPNYLMYPMPGSPGLYPMPSQYPPQAYGLMQGMPQQPEPPKKSGMPIVGMVMGIVAMVFGLLLLGISIMILDMSSYAVGSCCLGGLAFVFLDIVSSTLGIVFSAISMSKIKSKRIIPTPMAKIGLVLSILAILLMVFSIIIWIYWIMNPPEYSGGEIIMRTLGQMLS